MDLQTTARWNASWTAETARDPLTTSRGPRRPSPPASLRHQPQPVQFFQDERKQDEKPGKLPSHDVPGNRRREGRPKKRGARQECPGGIFRSHRHTSAGASAPRRRRSPGNRPASPRQARWEPAKSSSGAIVSPPRTSRRTEDCGSSRKARSSIEIARCVTRRRSALTPSSGPRAPTGRPARPPGPPTRPRVPSDPRTGRRPAAGRRSRSADGTGSSRPCAFEEGGKNPSIC